MRIFYGYTNQTFFSRGMYICMHVCECEFVRSFITGIATAESVCAENHKQYMYAQPCPAAQTAQPTPVLPPFFGKKLKRGLVRREKVENIEEQKKKRVFSSERRAVGKRELLSSRTPKEQMERLIRSRSLPAPFHQETVQNKEYHRRIRQHSLPSPVVRLFIKSQSKEFDDISLLHQRIRRVWKE
jgi:hypothetical protein